MAKPTTHGRCAGSALLAPLLATLVSIGSCGGSHPEPIPTIVPTVPVTVNGQTVAVPQGATVGQAMRTAGVRVRDGRLLDVEGDVIRENADPGRIFVNGEPAGRATIVSPGASIRTEDGTDHTEKTVRRQRRVEGPRPENPQYRLGTAPGIEIVKQGAISGKVASLRFKPTGRGTIPRAVALTFDDGPTPPYTRRVLKILKRYHVRATFFVVGYLAERYPAIVRRMVRQGHTVANHSWSHPLDRPFAQLEPRVLENQIRRTNDVLEKLGVEPFLFRPPGGSYDAAVVEAARRHGMRIAMWTIGTDDWRSDTTASEIRRHVLRRLRPGAIVLMHDGGGDQRATVRTLPDLIKAVRKRGYHLVPMTRNG